MPLQLQLQLQLQQLQLQLHYNCNCNYSCNYHCNYNFSCTKLHFIHNFNFNYTTTAITTTLHCNYSYSYNMLQLQVRLLHLLQLLQLRQLQLQLPYNYNYNYNHNHNCTYDITTSTTSTPLQLQLQLQLQHCTTPHYIQELWVRSLQPLHKAQLQPPFGSVHQWIRSAIHASQQPTSPIASYLWNFRRRLVRYYWYTTPQLVYLGISWYLLPCVKAVFDSFPICYLHIFVQHLQETWHT